MEFIMSFFSSLCAHYFARVIENFWDIKGKGKYLDKPQEIKDLKYVRDLFQKGEIHVGDLIKVPVQFSKFLNLHLPYSFSPVYLAGVPREFNKMMEGNMSGPGTMNAMTQISFSPVGTVPKVVRNLNIGRVYRPVFRNFPRPFLYRDYPIQKYINDYFCLPIIYDDNRSAFEERRVDLIARLSEVPYNVYAEIYKITRDRFLQQREMGLTLFLSCIDECSSMVLNERLEATFSKLQGGIYIEFCTSEGFDPTELKDQDKFEKILSIFAQEFQNCAVRYFPEGGLDIPENIKGNIDTGTTFVARLDHKQFKLFTWSFPPVYLNFKAPSFFSLYYPMDLKNEYVAQIERFDNFSKEMIERIRLIISKIANNEARVTITFMSNYDRQSFFKIPVLAMPEIEKLGEEYPFIKSTARWLRGLE